MSHVGFAIGAAFWIVIAGAWVAILVGAYGVLGWAVVGALVYLWWRAVKKDKVREAQRRAEFKAMQAEHNRRGTRWAE